LRYTVRMSLVYLNGKLLPKDQACISIADAGFLHGASVFTTMRAHRGVVFRLDRHIRRLMETLEFVGIAHDASADDLARWTRELLAANQLSESRLRITLTPGQDEFDSGASPTTLITAEPLPQYPAEWYEKGLTVVISSFKQARGDPTFGYKTGCYLPRVLARQEAACKGAEEALWFTWDNRLAEACFCNVFVVRDGKVFTPPRDTPVLPGVVREAVIELCAAMGIECSDADELTIDDLLGSSEVFLTGSCTGIRPVVRIERQHVVGEGPGELTGWIMRAYQDLLDSECSR